MNLLKRLFLISDNTGHDFAVAVGIHVVHAFLYGMIGAVISPLPGIDANGENMNLVLFVWLWRTIGIVIEYYIALRYLQLLIAAIIADIKSDEYMPGKNLFIALAFLFFAFVVIRFMEVVGSNIIQIIILMVVLLIVFIYVGTAAMGSIFAVFSNGIFVGILSTAGIFSLISSIFISALPYILGVGAISIIYDSIRMLFS